MTEGKLMNRWWVVVGAILIQLCLGAIYAWNVFTNALTQAPYDFTQTQTQIIFAVGLATFAVVMILAGRLQAKFPPRLIALAGGLVLGIGYVAAGFVGTSFAGHVITIGLLGGAGIGLAYVIPIAVGVRWFPDKKGMLTGLAVAGFGFGALLWIKLAGSPGYLIANFGVANVFIIYGIAFAVLVSLGSLVMVNPPEGYRPEGWQPPAAGTQAGISDHDMSPREMLATPQFYMLWTMFIAGAMAGLMVIGIIKLFGMDALTLRFASEGLGQEDAALKAAAVADTAMAVFYALANGLGRIVWGIISDRLGRKLSLFLMLASQGVFMLLFFYMAGNPYLLYLGAALIGFNFGGNFALFPAATADLFGSKNVGINYGWVFTAYGIGGIAGPILGGWFGDLAEAQGNINAWLTPFLIAGVACLVIGMLALALKPPKAPEAAEAVAESGAAEVGD